MSYEGQASQSDLEQYFLEAGTNIMYHGTVMRDATDQDREVSYFNELPITWGMAYRITCKGSHLIETVPRASQLLGIKADYDIDLSYYPEYYFPFHTRFPDETFFHLPGKYRLPETELAVSAGNSIFYRVGQPQRSPDRDKYITEVEADWGPQYDIEGQPRSPEQINEAKDMSEYVTPRMCRALIMIAQQIPAIRQLASGPEYTPLP